MTASLQPLLVFLLAAFSTGCLLWALFQPRLGGGSRAGDRFGAIANGPRSTMPGAARDRGRKQTVEQALREIAEKEMGADGKRRKASLSIRLRQAGLGWSRQTYYLVSLSIGLLAFLAALVALGIGQIPAVGFGVGAALLGPNFIVNRKRNRRISKFVSALPDALDVITRGVKAGLPLADCLKSLAAEADEPVRGEFKAMVDDHTMGMPLSEAAARLPERMPVPEATFFAIVIAIQSRSGGSLSEALGNLAKVVRERKKMKNKIQAMSSEAKVSAMIIGALPFLVAGVLSVLAPDYVALLFSDIVGNIILAVSAVWMVMGMLVMRKMINFDF